VVVHQGRCVVSHHFAGVGRWWLCRLIAWLDRWCGWVLEIVRKLEQQTGFQLLRKRWIVERTFAWLGHSRRLSKDYEELVENSEAMIHIAMIRLMLQRLCRTTKHQRR
jgi:transposase